MWWHYDTGMGWWMIAWMVVFWGVLIALIVWGIRKLTERGDSTRKQDPLNVVKERYARGEITKEEFEQLKKDLS